jgi:hypothetical protein
MIELQNNPDNNIVELTVEGKITEADFDRVIAQIRLTLRNTAN